MPARPGRRSRPSWRAPRRTPRAADLDQRRAGQQVGGRVVRLPRRRRPSRPGSTRARRRRRARVTVGADLDLLAVLRCRAARRRRADSSTTWRGTAKCSTGETSTSLEAHSVRKRAEAQAPFDVPGGVGDAQVRRASSAARRRPARSAADGQRTPLPPIASSVRPAKNGTASNSALEAMAPASTRWSSRRGPRAPRPRRSPASSRARRAGLRPAARGRPIAGRSRCTRPSGCTSVPSFSGYASAGNTTSAYSRTCPSSRTRGRSRSGRCRAPPPTPRGPGGRAAGRRAAGTGRRASPSASAAGDRGRVGAALGELGVARAQDGCRPASRIPRPLVDVGAISSPAPVAAARGRAGWRR